MAIDVRAINTLAAGNRTNSTVPAPAGVQDGDVLIAFLLVGDPTAEPTLAVTPPAGWTEFGSSPVVVSKADPYTVAWRAYRKVAAGEPANWTWTHAVADTEAMVYAISGADTANPVTNVSFNEGTGQTTSVTGFTTLADGQLIIMAEAVWDDTTGMVPPSGSTPVMGVRYQGGSVYVSDGILSPAGATGDKSHTNGNNSLANPWAVYLVGVAPAAGNFGTGAGSAPGVATVTGAGTALGIGAASGTAGNSASVTGTAILVAQGDGATAPPTVTVTGTGAAITFPDGAGASDGAASVSGSGLAVTTSGAVGAADGVATVSGTGTALGTGEAVGLSDGVASVSGTGEAVPAGSTPGAGTADGVASVTGTGASRADAVGLAAGVASVASQTPGTALTGGGGGGGLGPASEKTYKARKEYERRRRLKDRGEWSDAMDDSSSDAPRPPTRPAQVKKTLTPEPEPEDPRPSAADLIAAINRAMAVPPFKAPRVTGFFDPEDDAETVALLD